jgi:hypothetical protein
MEYSNKYGLQFYCKSDFFYQNPLIKARILLETAPYYSENKVSENQWKIAKKVVGDIPLMSAISIIVRDAWYSFFRLYDNGQASKEERDYIVAQVKAYNAMVKQAYKEAEKEGTANPRKCIRPYDPNDSKKRKEKKAKNNDLSAEK